MGKLIVYKKILGVNLGCVYRYSRTGNWITVLHFLTDLCEVKSAGLLWYPPSNMAVKDGKFM